MSPDLSGRRLRVMDRVRRRARGAASLAALAALAALTLAACSDGGTEGSEETPEDVLAAAKVALDETSGVTLSLTTEKLPEDVDGEVVLSSYTGTLPGRVVDASIPSADEDATFPATFRIDEDGRLRSVDVSGPFYGPDGTVDYTVSVDDYGTDQDISAP
jgi:hypothetical protein